MPKRCPDCHQRTSTLGRCPQCRAEHVAKGVDHSPTDTRTCAWCGGQSTEGHYERPGMWLCRSCVRRQIAAETPDTLNGAVRWAVGDDDAFPDEAPVDIDAGFEPASTRVAADGGRDVCTHCEETIERDPGEPPVTFEGEPIHWDCLEEIDPDAGDDEWHVKQRGLGGQAAQGQTTIDGGVAKDGGSQ